MQTLTREPQIKTERAQPSGIIVTAIIIFALAGLLSGFAIGGFVRPLKNPSTTLPNQTSTSPKLHTTQTPSTPITTEHPTPMGFPAIDHYQYIEIADGSTAYSFTAHAIEKDGTSITSSSITCKIWLTHNAKVNNSITGDRLRSVDTLDQPFPDEAQGTMNFSASTPQTQMCSNGTGHWSYMLSPTLHPGLYYIVTLMDWDGVHYNWSWVAIRIRSSKSN